MPGGFIPSLAHRAWWWVFALFIATPAMVLALLGLQAIRTRDFEREQGLREQQTQLAQVVNSSLANAFDHVATEALAGANTSDLVAFEIDTRGIVSFPRDRVFAGPFGAVPAALLPERPLSADTILLVDRAQSAEARLLPDEARALYERMRTNADLAPWARLRLALLDAEAGDRSRFSVAADSGLAASAARTPAGIPLAVTASGISDVVPAAARPRFIPLITATLRELRAGRWWLSIDQRQTYDAELRRWLANAGGESIAPLKNADARVAQLAALDLLVRDAFAQRRASPSRADIVPGPNGGTLLLWLSPGDTSSSWTGTAVTGNRLSALFTETIAPLLAGYPFRAVLRTRRGDSIHGSLDGATEQQSVTLDSAGDWQLAFTGALLPATGRLLNYATVVLPIVVLATGLLMTAWIVRRDVALARLQSTFVAGVTHEFKSPITSIRLLMERLASGRLTPDDSPHRYYAAIGAETDRLEGLVNRLLESQKLQSGRKSYAFKADSLTALVSSSIDRLRPQAEAKKIRVDVRMDNTVPDLPLDRESMTEAIGNLLDNAIKYSAAETTISVSVERSDDIVRIDVVDEGIGVDPSDVERIFDPFYRSRRGDHENVHGTGLGLSLVKAAAEAHGGSVEVASNGARGSRFSLRLPVQEGA